MAAPKNSRCLCLLCTGESPILRALAEQCAKFAMAEMEERGDVDWLANPCLREEDWSELRALVQGEPEEDEATAFRRAYYQALKHLKKPPPS